MKLATKVIKGEKLRISGFHELLYPLAVKTPQFSRAQPRDAYPFLGLEMRDTSEVAALGKSFESMMLKSWISASPNDLIKPGSAILSYSYDYVTKHRLSRIARIFASYGAKVLTTDDDDLVDGSSRPLCRS